MGQIEQPMVGARDLQPSLQCRSYGAVFFSLNGLL